MRCHVLVVDIYGVREVEPVGMEKPNGVDLFPWFGFAFRHFPDLLTFFDSVGKWS